MVEETMNQSREINSVILFLDQSFGVLRSSGEGGTVSLAGIDLAPGTVLRVRLDAPLELGQ